MHSFKKLIPHIPAAQYWKLRKLFDPTLTSSFHTSLILSPFIPQAMKLIFFCFTMNNFLFLHLIFLFYSLQTNIIFFISFSTVLCDTHSLRAIFAQLYTIGSGHLHIYYIFLLAILFTWAPSLFSQCLISLGRCSSRKCNNYPNYCMIIIMHNGGKRHSK